MPKLAEVYVEELSEGRIPSENSPEAVAYREWSREYERNRIVDMIVRESCLKVYGGAYYLLGSMI